MLHNLPARCFRNPPLMFWAVARSAGSIAFSFRLILGLAPQALCFRPLRGLNRTLLHLILGLAPQALCFHPLRGLNRTLLH